MKTRMQANQVIWQIDTSAYVFIGIHLEEVFDKFQGDRSKFLQCHIFSTETWGYDKKWGPTEW